MKILRAFTVLTGSLLLILVPKKFASACGFIVYSGEYRFWLMQPDLTNEQDLTPFFFASSYLYHGDINAAVETYEDQNTGQWYAEIKKQASKKDIDELLHNTKPQYFFDHEKDIRRSNSFLAWLSRPGNEELYKYFVISKKTEQIGGDPDPWGESDFPHPSVNTIINETDELYHKTRSPFLKLRAAYQLMRLYGYNGLEDKVRKTYDERIAKVRTDSWIKTAALYNRALHTRGYEQDYLFSKVFDRGGYRRSYCLMKMDSENADTILRFAKNAHERTVINAMRVFNYPGRSLSRIKNIYATEPGYKDLPFLLLREINKIEDWLVTTKVTEFGMPAVYNGSFWDNYDYPDDAASNYRNDKKYAAEFYSFLLRLIGEKKQKDNALLRLYAAHLALLNGNADESARLLSEIENVHKLPANVQTQLAINRFLLHLEKGFDQTTENEFMRIVTKSPEQLGVYDPGIMKDQLILYTSRKLIGRGLKTKGLMLLSQTNRALGGLPIGSYKMIYQEIEEIATPAVYDEILTILNKKTKSRFERFVTRGFGSSMGYYEDEQKDHWDRNKLLDCKASWYIRNHDLVSARATMQQLPESFWSQEPRSIYIGGDPFYVDIYKVHGSITNDRQNLNKKQVVEAMIGLESLASRDGKKAAECYFQLANAWYNMTWYGKNWLMVRQWWSSNDPAGRDELKQRPAFMQDYYGCQTAKGYYLKAMRSTNDKDLASLCCFMAGECEDNYRLYSSVLNDREYETSKNPYTRLLKQKGIGSKVYDQLVDECALYQDFIKRYNRPI